MDLGNLFGKKGVSSQLLGFDKLVNKYADEEDDLNKNLDDEDLEKDEDAQDFGDISLSDDMEDDTEEEKKNEEDLEKKRKEEEERLQNKQRRKEKRELLKAQLQREETELLKSQEAAKSSRFQNLDVTLEVMAKQEFQIEDLARYKSVVSGINSEGKAILKFSEIFFGKKEYQYPVAPKSIAFVSKKHKMKKQLADEKLFLSTVSFVSETHAEDTDTNKPLTDLNTSTSSSYTDKIFETNKDILTYKPPMGFPLHDEGELVVVGSEKDDVDMVDEKQDKEKGEEEASSEYIEEVSKDPIEEFLAKNENEIGSVDFNMWEMNIQWGDNEESSDQNVTAPTNSSSFLPNVRIPTQPTSNPKHFGAMNTEPQNTTSQPKNVPPPKNVPSTKNTDSKTTLHRPTNISKKPNEKFLTKKKTVNDDLHNGDWLQSVVWDETSQPSLPVNTKLILDLNDAQVTLVQFDKERLQSESKQREREEFYKRKEVEDVERLLEEEMEANAPAETKRKRGRPPTKKDPEMIKANNKMIQSSKLEIKKKELFEKRSKLRKLIPVNDPWNISKDSEYLANFGSDQKSEENAKLKKIFIQHSLPTQNIEVFKTHFTPKELDNFHKPKFDIEPNDHFSLCWTKPPPENDDDNFFVLRRLKDMSGLQNNIAVVEYLEEWPLLVNNVGMEMKLQTFYRKKSEDENVSGDDPKVKGELVTLDPNEDSPFYGQIPPGVHIPIFNSNLFRAPVGSHKMKETDFLVVFQKEQVEPQNIQCSNTLPKVASVRPLDKVHTVGQQQPLCKVPPPGKRPYNNYIKNRLQHHIFRLFKDPTRKFQIQISDIMDAYPAIAETAVRNRLKFCFFVRATGHWILNPGLILPDEQEMRNIVKPEHICAFESCLSGQRRLEQIGIQKVQNIRDFPKAFAKIKNDQRRTGDFMMLEQEILRAPWSITTDYFEAITENKKMRVTGIGDPSQVGDMCSFLKAPLRPDKPTANSKGRKRKIDNDVVEDSNNDFIFDDGSDFKYRQQIDQVFLRNAQLVVDPNPDIRVYDENESSDDESDLDKLGQDIENLLDDREEHLTKALQRSIIETTKTNSSYVPKRKKKTEEEERDYQRIMLSIQVKEELKENGIDPESEEGKRIISERVGHHKDVAHDTIWIKLTKKEENVDGSVKQVIQIVKDPKIVEQYRKKLKKPSLGRAQKKVTAPITLKEEAEQANVKKAKRKLQEKLRRLKRIQETQKENAAKLIKAYQQGIDPSAPTDDGVLRCAACGLAGHMKTNRKCPLFVAKDELPTSTVVPTPSTDKKNLVIRFKTNDIASTPTTNTSSSKKGSTKKEGGSSTSKKTPAKKKTKKNIDFSDEDY